MIKNLDKFDIDKIKKEYSTELGNLYDYEVRILSDIGSVLKNRNMTLSQLFMELYKPDDYFTIETYKDLVNGKYENRVEVWTDSKAILVRNRKIDELNALIKKKYGKEI